MKAVSDPIKVKKSTTLGITLKELQWYCKKAKMHTDSKPSVRLCGRLSIWMCWHMKGKGFMMRSKWTSQYLLGPKQSSQHSYLNNILLQRLDLMKSFWILMDNHNFFQRILGGKGRGSLPSSQPLKLQESKMFVLSESQAPDCSGSASIKSFTPYLRKEKNYAIAGSTVF